MPGPEDTVIGVAQFFHSLQTIIAVYELLFKPTISFDSAALVLDAWIQIIISCESL